MKRTITLIILSIASLMAVTVVAQQPRAKEGKHHARWEDFRQAKHAFYTENLSLRPSKLRASLSSMMKWRNVNLR